MDATLAETYKETQKYKRRWLTLGVLAVSLIVIALDTTILNIAVPTLQRELSASASALQWIVASYILVFAGLLLTMGSLGDRFGRKRALQTGLVLFGIASAAAAYSQTSGQLIAARSLMGVGAALIMPSTLSVIIDVFPRDERGRAIGIWSATAGLGIPLGMIVGGWLLESFWWGSVFLLNIPVGLMVLFAGFKLIPESRDPEPKRLDTVGALLSVVGLTALVYAIIEAPERGWLDPVVVVGFGAAAVLTAAFVLYELRTDHPMLDVRFFRNPRLSAGATAISISFLAMLGMMFLISQYLQFVRGYGPLDTGVRLIPIALGFMAAGGSSDRFVKVIGTKRVVFIGMIVLIGVLGAFSLLTADTPYWLIGVGFFALGFGMGNVMAPATEAVMGAVPEANAGVGSALNDVTRNVGGALGVGIMGTVVNTAYAPGMANAIRSLPAEAAAAAENSIGGAGQIAASIGGSAGEALIAAANASFIDAFSWSLGVAAGIAAVGAFVVLLFMPARELTPDELAGLGEREESDAALFANGVVAPVPVRIDE